MMKNWLYALLFLAFLSNTCFAKTRTVVIAYIPEWLENQNSKVAQLANYLEKNKSRYNIITSILPTKRSLNFFKELKDGCYLPTGPVFIKDYTSAKPEDLLFLKLGVVDLQRYVLKERKDSKKLHKIGTVRISDPINKLIRDKSGSSNITEVLTETKAIKMLKRERFDSLYLWGVSQRSNGSDLYIIPNSSIMKFEVGLVCIDNKENRRLIADIKKNFK